MIVLNCTFTSQDPVQPGTSGEGSGFKVGKRLVGGDLALPCHLPINCTNVWGRPLSDGKRYQTPSMNDHLRLRIRLPGVPHAHYVWCVQFCACHGEQRQRDDYGGL